MYLILRYQTLQNMFLYRNTSFSVRSFVLIPTMCFLGIYCSLYFLGFIAAARAFLLVWNLALIVCHLYDRRLDRIRLALEKMELE